MDSGAGVFADGQSITQEHISVTVFVVPGSCMSLTPLRVFAAASLLMFQASMFMELRLKVSLLSAKS